jgi:hypothetical protein
VRDPHARLGARAQPRRVPHAAQQRRERQPGHDQREHHHRVDDAPSTNASTQVIRSTAWATAATAPMVSSTSPTASSTIGQAFALSSGHDELTEAEYSSGGRKTKKTTSGSSSGEGRLRHEADDQPAEHQRHRVRHAAAQPQPGEERDREQQEHEELDVAHGMIEPTPCRT